MQGMRYVSTPDPADALAEAARRVIGMYTTTDSSAFRELAPALAAYDAAAPARDAERAFLSAVEAFLAIDGHYDGVEDRELWGERLQAAEVAMDRSHERLLAARVIT